MIGTCYLLRTPPPPFYTRYGCSSCCASSPIAAAAPVHHETTSASLAGCLHAIDPTHLATAVSHRLRHLHVSKIWILIGS
jgi:hypothetical protein